MKRKNFITSLVAGPKKNWHKPFLVMTIFCTSVSALAQSTDKFFGMNYWEYAVYNGVTTDKFKDLMPETNSWNLKMIRIGGNYPNVNKNQSGDKDWYVNAIVNAKAIGGTPLVQLPINLASTEVAAWMDYFNVTKNLGVTYWGIGNEPDPSSGYGTWFAGTTTADGNTYAQFKSKFKAIAKAIKAKDANSIICGPDFRHWWGSVDNAATPFGGWYKDFLYGSGTNSVGTDSFNGDQIIDIFAFHFYGDGGSGNFDEGELSIKYAEMMKLIDATNALRPAGQPIRIACGEYNDNYNYTGFRVGQRMAIMAKQSLKNNAVYLTPWSLCEGNSWAMIDKSTGVLYSSAHHWKMLSQNQRGNYMNSEVNDNHNYDIVPFGMKDANGYTIVLLNEGATDYTFSVKFSTTAGNYSVATAAIKFRFDANVNVDFANLTLYKNSTLLFTFDAAGNMLKKIEYKSGNTAPVTTTYSVTNVAPAVSFTSPAEGDTFEVGADVQFSATASDIDGTILKVEFYDGAATTPFHTENLAPYDFVWNTLPVGLHTISAKAYDDDGATTTATRSINIVNTPPTVSITAPTNGTSVPSGTSITVTASAADAAPGTVTSVSFYVGANATPIATDATSPYSVSWASATAGTYSITAKAIDNNGSVTTSSPISITITSTNDPLTQSYFHIENKWTGDYMRPTGGSATATIIQEQSATTPTLSSFQWEFRAAPTNGYYFIVNRYTGNAIQPTGGSNAEGVGLSQVALTTSNQNTTTLHWVIEASGEANYYWIKNRYSAKYIRPNGGADGTGVAIVQNALNASLSSFKWSFANPVSKSARMEVATDESQPETTASSIYPNPAFNKVTVVTEVKCETSVAISFYNVLGMEVLSNEFEGVKGHFERSFDISEFPSGAFILKIRKENSIQFKHVIKK